MERGRGSLYKRNPYERGIPAITLTTSTVVNIATTNHNYHQHRRLRRLHRIQKWRTFSVYESTWSRHFVECQSKGIYSETALCLLKWYLKFFTKFNLQNKPTNERRNGHSFNLNWTFDMERCLNMFIDNKLSFLVQENLSTSSMWQLIRCSQYWTFTFCVTLKSISANVSRPHNFIFWSSVG
jgi:hypothetical protein